MKFHESCTVADVPVAVVPSTKAPSPPTLLTALQDASASLMDAVAAAAAVKTLKQEANEREITVHVDALSDGHNAIMTTAVPLPSLAHGNDVMDPSVAAFMAAQEKHSRLELGDWARLLVNLPVEESRTTAVTTTRNAVEEQGQAATLITAKKSPHLDNLVRTFQTALVST